MSFPNGLPDVEVSRRSGRAQILVWAVYVGLPIVFLVLTLAISAAAGSETFNWQAGLVPLGVIVLGWWFRRRSRYRPTRWATAGATTGGVTGFFTVFYTIVLDGPGMLFLPGAVVGGAIGYAIGWYGERTLMHPLVPGLAETPYELTFRMRGRARLAMVLTNSRISLQTSIRIRTAEGDSTSLRARSYPLDSISRVSEVTLTGAERLEYPLPMDKPPLSSSGSALVLQIGGVDWILPHDEAPALAQIVTQRMAAAPAT